MTAQIETIRRYPIKGLSAEFLNSVSLRAGDGIPGDRFFGFARHGSGFDPAAPKPMSKENFLVLMDQAPLAGVQTRFDPDTGLLQLQAADDMRSFDMNTAQGSTDAANWFADYLALDDEGAPVFVSSFPHRFTDVCVYSPQLMNAVSLINLNTVARFADDLGQPVDPERFRANIDISGLPAGWELDNIGRELRLGDVTLRLLKRTQRCAATEVNPDTTERDIKLPYALRKAYGHMDMGVYAEVVTGGTLAPGTAVSIV